MRKYVTFLLRWKLWLLTGVTVVIVHMAMSALFSKRRHELSASCRRERRLHSTMSDCYDCLRRFQAPDRQRKVPRPTYFDANGHALYSWRFRMPMADTGKTSGFGPRDLGQAWNSHANANWAHPDLSSYYPDPVHFIDTDRWGYKARVVAIVGDGTAFDDAKQNAFCDLPANLIILIERRKCDTNWIEPGGDVTVDQLSEWFEKTEPDGRSRQVYRLGKLDNGFFVAFANGGVELISYDIPFSALRPFLLIESARIVDRRIIRKYLVDHCR